MLNITELTCRVCLQEQEVLVNVFEELEDLQTTLSSLLQTCGDIQVDNDDEFPKYLCEECTGELLIAAKFREKCLKSKETLRNVQQNNDIGDSCDDSYEIIEYSPDPVTVPECEEQEAIITPNLDSPEDRILESPQNCIQETTTECSEPEENECEVQSCTAEDNDKDKDTTVESADDMIGNPSPILDYFQISNEICDYQVQIEIPDTELIKPIPAKGQRKIAYKCDICGAAFVQAMNLQKHLQKNHAPVQCYTCRICDHWFTLENELINHESLCKEASLNEDEKKKRKSVTYEPVESHRKCMYCDRECQTPFALRTHLRTHTGERPFPCSHCDKAFKTQSSLSAHTKRHTGQADFVCTVCGKSFFEQGNLNVHMRSHTGDRPHICTVCKKTFTRVFLLELHMRIHTGEKPFTCSYCDRSFRQRTDWKSHLSTHTGIKQYNCRLCKKGYVKRASFIHHMQSNHALQMDIEDQAEDEHKNDTFNAFDSIIETEDGF